MTKPPDLTELQNGLLHDMSLRADTALMAGLDHATVAYVLRMLSTEAAMKGGTETLYKHSLFMQSESEDLREEFIARFS
ncbi:MAG: hypothetical protein ACFB11_22220 [Paracoccaceae bacterium]